MSNSEKVSHYHTDVSHIFQHHCRACGQIFCGKCSSKYSTIPKFGIEKEVRVCEPCYEHLNKSVPLVACFLLSTVGTVRGNTWHGAVSPKTRAKGFPSCAGYLGFVSSGHGLYSCNVVQNWGSGAKEEAHSALSPLSGYRKAEGKAAAASELPPEYLTSPLSQQSQVCGSPH